MDHGRLLNLFESVLLPELSVRVPLRMLVTDPRDLREVFSPCAVAGGQLVDRVLLPGKW